MEEVDEDMQDIMDLEDLEFTENCRDPRWNHLRLNWEAHVLQLQHENRFHREYRMSLNAHQIRLLWSSGSTSSIANTIIEYELSNIY